MENSPFDDLMNALTPRERIVLSFSFDPVVADARFTDEQRRDYASLSDVRRRMIKAKALVKLRNEAKLFQLMTRVRESYHGQNYLGAFLYWVENG